MRRNALILAFLGAALFFCGCTQPQPMDVVARQPPDRQAALRKCDMFVGQWAVSGSIRGPGDRPPVSFSGKNDVRWEGELLVARGTTTVDGVDSTAMAILTYDPVADVYRTVVISPDGSVGTATSRFDAQEVVLRGRIESVGPNGAMIWEGSVRFLDADTKAERWVGQERGAAGKAIEISKTERRVP